VALDVNRWNDGALVEADAAPRRRLAATWHLVVSTLLSLVGF
jgi:hypothetical protein